MLILAAGAVACSLLRLAAPQIKAMVAARELSMPGMTYMEIGRRPTPIDGVWSPKEMEAVVHALQGDGDKRILAIGRERIAAMIQAGCPVCPKEDCRKLYPAGAPPRCNRCGHEMKPSGDKKDEPPPRGTA